jgi:hypothetical protein
MWDYHRIIPGQLIFSQTHRPFSCQASTTAKTPITAPNSATYHQKKNGRELWSIRYNKGSAAKERPGEEAGPFCVTPQENQHLQNCGYLYTLTRN